VMTVRREKRKAMVVEVERERRGEGKNSRN
jgi:hypothetical protein